MIIYVDVAELTNNEINELVKTTAQNIINRYNVEDYTKIIDVSYEKYIMELNINCKNENVTEISADHIKFLSIYSIFIDKLIEYMDVLGFDMTYSLDKSQIFIDLIGVSYNVLCTKKIPNIIQYIDIKPYNTPFIMRINEMEKKLLNLLL